MWEYYARSPLSHQSIQRAWEAGHRDAVTVLRSSSRAGVSRLGFMADAEQRRYLFRIPAVGRFVEEFARELKVYVRQVTDDGRVEADPHAKHDFAERMARKFAPRVADKRSFMAGIDSLLKFVLVHPNQYRSLDEENLAPFVVDVLHAQHDLGPKERLSATVNPTYLLRYDERSGVFNPKFAMAAPSVFMIQLPLSAVVVDNASRFVVQDEVRINSVNWGPRARRVTVWSMDADENGVFPLPPGDAPPEAVAVMDSIHAIATGLAPGRGLPRQDPEDGREPSGTTSLAPSRSPGAFPRMRPRTMDPAPAA